MAEDTKYKQNILNKAKDTVVIYNIKQNTIRSIDLNVGPEEWTYT